MQINEEFWGGEAQSYEIIPGVKRTSYNMKDAFNQEESAGWVLPLNEVLDTSISPWAINNNADVAKIAYGISYRTDPDSLAYEDPKFYSIHDFEKEYGGGIPIYFNVPYYAGNGGVSFNWFTRNGLAQANIYDPVNATYGNYRTMIYPIREFDYSKLLFQVQLVYGRSSDTDLGSPNVTTVDDYFSDSHTDAWRDDRPIVGINFIPYYRGWDTQYPTAWRQCSWNMNTLGIKKPCEVAPSGAGVGYNVDFIDDFMGLITAGAAIGAWRNNYGGTGRIRIYNGSVWASSEEQCASIVLSTSYDTEPILHVPILDDESKWKTNSHWTGTQDVQFRTELDRTKFSSYDEMKGYILTQAAYLGTWFITNANTVNTNPEPGSSDGWYLGEIGEDGVTTGNYKIGSSTSELDNSTWENPWDSSGWNGRPVDPDPTPYDKDLASQLIYRTLNPTRGSADYLMSGNALTSLLATLNWYKRGEASGTLPSGTCVTLFGTEDPLECVRSIILYPVDLSDGNWAGYPGTGMSGANVSANYGVGCGNIRIPCSDDGSSTVDNTIHLYNYNEIMEIDWKFSFPYYLTQELSYFQRYKSFLDYEPYCSAELYVPFCGSVKIDPELFVGHNIGVRYIVSPTEGVVKAEIFRDALVIDTITGNIGAQINLTTSDLVEQVNAIQQHNATIQAQKTNLVKSLAAFGLGAAMTAATGGAAAPVAMGALGAGASIANTSQAIQNAEYQIGQAEIPYKQLMSGSGLLSAQYFEKGIRLIIYRPICLPGYSRTDWGSYGHTTGFACLKNDTLSNYHGLTVCSSVDLTGTTCSEKEAEMIKKALKSGVYLP